VAKRHTATAGDTERENLEAPMTPAIAATATTNVIAISSGVKWPLTMWAMPSKYNQITAISASQKT
jgi:hypothetical protein